MFDVGIYGRLKRGPQVILLKDASLISGLTGLQSGDKVLDCGGGSGFLTIYLANIVAPSGKVFTYEKREDFANLVEKNVERVGLKGVVKLERKDLMLGVDEKDFDLVTLDFAESDKALPIAFDALKQNGFIVGYLPNVEQVKAFVLEGERLGLKHVGTFESILREMLVREKGCRPATKGLTHTGYLGFLKKV